MMTSAVTVIVMVVMSLAVMMMMKKVAGGDRGGRDAGGRGNRDFLMMTSLRLNSGREERYHVCPCKYVYVGSASFHFVRIPHNTEREPKACLLYTSPSPRDQRGSRMPSSA